MYLQILRRQCCLDETSLKKHIAHKDIEFLQQIWQNLLYSSGRKCSHALRPSLLLHKLCGQGSILFCCLEQSGQSGNFIHFNSFVVLNLFCQLYKLLQQLQLQLLFTNIFIKIYLIPQIPRCPMCRTLIHVRTRVFVNWRPTSMNNKFLYYCAIFSCFRKISSASFIKQGTK